MKTENTADKSCIMLHFTPYFLALLLFLSLPSEAEANAKNKSTQVTPKNRELKNQARTRTQNVKTKTRRTASTSGTRQITYPPPPADKHELPLPIQESIQAIEDVCKRVDSSFDQRKMYLKPILENLKSAIAFYKSNYFEQINPARLNEIHSDLFNIHMEVFWDAIYIKGQGWNIEEQFLLQHCMVSRLSSIEAGPKCIEYDWARKVYRGLYCLSRGRLPEEEK